MTIHPEVYRLLVLKHALKLEVKGYKRSRSPSTYLAVKREFGFKGNKQKVLAQLEEIIDQGMRA
jgi:hypothetical protein